MSVAAHHDLVPTAQPQSGVTYSEVRDWAVWLDMFTVADLADALGCDLAVAQRGINALLWHGICEDSGGEDSYGDPIITYIPLPPGPNEHYTQTPPENMPGVQDLAPRNRGMPVRLVDNTDRRNAMQGTGGARVRIKQRDKAYEAMEQAKVDRAERQRAKARAEAEGKANKQKGKTKTHAVDKRGKIGE